MGKPKKNKIKSGLWAKKKLTMGRSGLWVKKTKQVENH